MNKKRIVYSNEALSKMKKGIDKAYKAISSTLGPNGHNVLIQNDNGKLISTKDGVAVAKSIKLEDELEDIGAQTIIKSSIHANKIAGDGTTTATVLTYAIITEGLKHLNNELNVSELKRYLEKYKDGIIDEIDNMKVDVTSEEDYENVATISANGDEQIGKLIAEAFKSVGTDGVITVEKSHTGENSLEVVEGTQFNQGYLSPYFVTNEKTMQVEFEKPKYLFYEGKLQTAQQVLPILEYIASQNIPLVIIADDISNEALSVLIVNKAKGIVRVNAVKAPGYGKTRSELFNDMAILTDGIVVSPERGMDIEDIMNTVYNDDGEPIQNIDTILGSSRSFTCNNKQSTIIDGIGNIKKIEERAEQLQLLIDKAESDYEKEKYKDRLASMSGGVAIINAGGDSDIEIEDKKYRIEDALNATKSAIEDGILAGGGIALMIIWNKLKNSYEHHQNYPIENNVAHDIICNAIKQPFMKIINNAGINGDVIWNKLHTDEKKSISLNDGKDLIINNDGYDVRNKKYVNMLDKGIIDPTKVVKTAVKKAVSVASTFLMTNAVIVDIPEKKDDNQSNMY